MLRKTIRLIHLYLGLFAGVVVFIVAITGCCWVFQAEVKSILNEEIVVQSSGATMISPTQVKLIANAELPGRQIHGVLYENDDEHPIEIIFYEAEPEFYYSIFIDPYSGEVLKHEDHKRGFFAFVMDGHQQLWLPPTIGKPIVAYSTLVFLISIITGIILWWPKNKKNKKQRLAFDWKRTTGWKRRNFDLHAILGFYSSIIALFITVTGLVMALNWFYFSYYTAIGGTSEMRFVIPNNETELVQLHANIEESIDALPTYLKGKFPNAKDFEIHYPYADSASIYVEISYEDGVYYNSDYRFYDQHTLKEIETPSIYGKYKYADVQDKIMRMNYDIHVGSILGLSGKLLTFFASLLVATLPVTGVLLWRGRSKRSKQVTKNNSTNTSLL